MTSDDGAAGRRCAGDAGRGDSRTDATAFLAALRLSDSFLPVGTHTASYGLEQYLEEDEVESAAELTELLSGYLRRVVGPCETVALATAYDGAVRSEDDGAARSEGDSDARTADDSAARSGESGAEQVLAADRRLHAVTLPREFRESSTTAGRNLLELLAETDGLSATAAAYADAVEAGETPGHYPVALGVVAPSLGLSRATACLLHGYGFVSDMLGAAQRLGRFGHTAIQVALVELLEVVAELPAFADRDLEAMGSFAPLVDVAGMRHARADRRLFVS